MSANRPKLEVPDYQAILNATGSSPPSGSTSPRENRSTSSPSNNDDSKVDLKADLDPKEDLKKDSINALRLKAREHELKLEEAKNMEA